MKYFSQLKMFYSRRFRFIAQLSAIIFLSAIPLLEVHALGGDLGGSSFVGKFVAGQAINMVNEVMNMLVGAVALFFSISASLLVTAIEFGFKPLNSVEIIISVWTIFRDVANVFFIFILLVIAIATILRLESYGIKRLLPTLIIVALLINFSLLTTQYVIYPANWLSEDIAKSMAPAGVKLESKLQGAFQVNTLVASIDRPPAAWWGTGVIGSVAAGCGIGVWFFGVGCVIGGGVGALSHFIVSSIVSTNSGFEQEMKIFAYLAGVLAVLGFATFTLIASAIMVIARTAVLILLMVVSPLAFLAHAVPGAQGYARKWWSALLSQSFFLPVYLLFIYLAIGIADAVTEGVKQQSAKPNILENPQLLYFYVLPIIIFVAGLMFAKQMGAYGAGLAIRYGQRGYRAAGGYAGKLALRSTVAPVAEKLKDSRITKGMMQYMPRAGTAVAAVLQKGSQLGDRQKIAEQRAALIAQMSPQEQAKAFANAPKREQDAMLAKKNAREVEEMRRRAARPSERAAIEEGIDRFGDAKWAQTILRRDMDEIKAAWDATTNDDRKQNIINETQKETLQNLANKFNTDPEREAFVRQVNALNPERIGDVLSVLPAQFAAAGKRADEVANKVDIQKISETYVRDHRLDMGQIAYHMNMGQFKQAATRGGEVFNVLTEEVRGLGRSLDDVAAGLDTYARAVPGALPTTASGTGTWIRRNPREAARVFGP